MFQRQQGRDTNRESLNSPIGAPHVQSGSGTLNHTGGTYSHSGVMDCLRIHLTEWNLGKFPDSSEEVQDLLRFEDDGSVEVHNWISDVQWVCLPWIGQSVQRRLT